MSDPLLSGFQALQLLALGPCIFMLFFLLLTSRKPLQVIVPCLFFVALSCSFCLPLLEAFPPSLTLKAALLMGENLTPALIFLLVVQFTTGKVPPLLYWLILAVPLVGGATLVNANLIGDSTETCVWNQVCLKPSEYRELYNAFTASFTLLLTVVVFSRVERSVNPSSKLQQTLNALVFALVILNVAIVAIDLLRLNDLVNADNANTAISVVRIGFIYLVLTSIFRVFDRSVEIAYERVPHLRPVGPTDKEKELAEKVRILMVQDKLYRKLDMGREKLAKHMAVTEQVLSRVVNLCLGQSTSTLINQYRVDEAKERLAKEDTAVTTIAFEVGFNSIPSFNRVFKQATGLAPSAYRTVHQPKQA